MAGALSWCAGNHSNYERWESMRYVRFYTGCGTYMGSKAPKNLNYIEARSWVMSGNELRYKTFRERVLNAKTFTYDLFVFDMAEMGRFNYNLDIMKGW